LRERAQDLAQKFMEEKLKYMDWCINNLYSFCAVSYMSHVLGQFIQDGKSILLTQLLGLYSRNGHWFLSVTMSRLYSAFTMLMGTGEVIHLGTVKLITISVHNHASTLINDYP